MTWQGPVRGSAGVLGPPRAGASGNGASRRTAPWSGALRRIARGHGAFWRITPGDGAAVAASARPDGATDPAPAAGVARNVATTS